MCCCVGANSSSKLVTAVPSASDMLSLVTVTIDIVLIMGPSGVLVMLLPVMPQKYMKPYASNSVQRLVLSTVNCANKRYLRSCTDRVAVMSTSHIREQSASLIY